MSDTYGPGSVAFSGLPALTELEPWDIAVLLIAPGVDVEHASDEQFDAWIAAQDIPVYNEGFDGWCFEDRCGVINHARRQGSTLSFVDPAGNKNNSEQEQKQFPDCLARELFAPHDTAQEGK